VLGGEQGPVLDTVLLNAAAALAAFNGIPNGGSVIPALNDGVSRAREAVSSGAAAQLLRSWVGTSRRLAATD
jgi:anthranilate phosphoribosyltransferase